jgi:tRNA(Ile)-lysidine synthase
LLVRRKRFFFEKKNQKTFTLLVRGFGNCGRSRPRTKGIKVFFASFFSKKEALPYFPGSATCMTLEQKFAAAMARLGPYGAHPRLALAVSGGADSTALALLAQAWAAENAGSVLALIVDHGLRQEAAAEATLTAERLRGRGIASRILTLTGLSGAAIQEKARAARHEALAAAALESGCLHLLLGHHAADQAETVAMRLKRGPHGAEGIAAWTARNKILLLRPLLAAAPAELHDYLRATNMGWVEDPSNQAVKFERVRIRQAGTAAPPPTDPGTRQARELDAAKFLARHASLHPEGYALLDAAAAPPAALAALIRTIGGAK